MSAAVSHAGASGVVAPAVGKTNVKDDNKCVLCEFVMQFLRNMLEQKDTRVRTLESYCFPLAATILSFHRIDDTRLKEQ